MFSLRLSLIAVLPLIAAIPASAISITQFNSPIGENFDSLAATSTSSALPTGWSLTETGTGADTTYAAGAGASSTGNTYSFGATGSTERAFGTLLTSSLTSILGVSFTNDTGGAITELAIGFDGEQWRLGATGRNDRLDFAYSLDDATWIDVDALDFLAPNSTGVTGALDGNAGPNRIAVLHTLTGLNISQGGNLYLRWVDFNATGSDDGLAIDNFSLTALQTDTPPPVNSVPDHLPFAAIITLFAGLLLFHGGERRESRS